MFARVLAITVLVASVNLVVNCARASDAPNIVLIMSDDMGFSDLGCYGSEINTPHLDQLADHGVRFTQFYNTARCCPTRAALLTGVYQHQAGIGLMTDDSQLPGYRGELGRDVVSIAEALSARDIAAIWPANCMSHGTSARTARRIIGRYSVDSRSSMARSLVRGAFTIRQRCAEETPSSRQ